MPRRKISTVCASAGEARDLSSLGHTRRLIKAGQAPSSSRPDSCAAVAR